MKTNALTFGLAGLLIIGAVSHAQDQDPASPKVGNAERGRILLSVLGPKPHTAAGISPLQQEELNRRIRCAATRSEIQDQLDFEAAGSNGFYVMSQLRAAEKEICNSPSLLPQPALVLRPPAPTPPVRPPPPPTQAAQVVRQPVAPVQQPPLPPAPLPRPAAVTAAAAAPPPKPPVVNAPAYTPSPAYPAEEMAAGHEGVVLVKLVMNADGTVNSVSLAKSCNYPVLDASALTVARTWRIPAAAGRTIEVPLKFSAH